MIHTPETSYYPASGLLRIQDMLLKNMRNDGPGWHFWHAVVHKPRGIQSIRILQNDEHERILSMHFDGTEGGFIANDGGFVVLFMKRVFSVQPIQRSIRKFLARRRAAKALVLAMALHP
jgi:hypothetical protein